jgi:outer membrane lipoprotein LolB
MNLRLMQRHALTVVLSFVLSFVLGGCATITPPAVTDHAQLPSADRGVAPRPYAGKVSLGGRLSVRYQNNGKEEAVHGSFLWTQDPGQTNVTLLSPLGQTIAVIEAGPSGATLAQSGQPLRNASDVDTLVADTLGWPLPISGLREWLQGFAFDAAGKRFIATPQATNVSTQDGWHIRYANWQDDSQSTAPKRPERPKRIDLERHTAQAGNVSIRIVIDTWQASQ